MSQMPTKTQKERSTKQFRKTIAVGFPDAAKQISLSLAAQRVKEFLWGNQEGYLGKRWGEHKKLSLRSTYVRQAVDDVIAEFHPDTEGRDFWAESSEQFRTKKGRQEAISGLYRSNYTAHLVELFGQPADFLISSEDPGSLGFYKRKQDTVTLSDDEHTIKDLSEARGALAHEMAHVWQARQGDLLGEIWTEHKIPAPPKNRGSYAIASRIEHQAEAIASALGLLDAVGLVGRLDPEDLLSLIQEVETDVPGTIIMMRLFLSHPLYKDFGPSAEYLAKSDKAEVGLDLTPIGPPGGWVKPVSLSLDERFQQSRMAQSTSGWRKFQRASARAKRLAQIEDAKRVAEGAQPNLNLQRSALEQYKLTARRVLGPTLAVSIAGAIAASQGFLGPETTLALGALSVSVASATINASLIEHKLSQPRHERATQKMQRAMEWLLSPRAMGQIVTGLQVAGAYSALYAGGPGLVKAGIIGVSTAMAVQAARKNQQKLK